MSQAPDQDRGADPETEEEARQRRLSALRQLAGTSPQLPAVRPGGAEPAAGGARSVTGRTRRRPWWLAAAALVLVVAVVAGLFLTGHLAPSGSRSATTAAAPVEIAPSGANLLCPQDIAWSPDGTRLAVLGYQRTCFDARSFSTQEPSALLIIYNARTGKQIQSIPLDPPIVAAFPIDPSVADAFGQIGVLSLHLVIDYSHVVWLPDGTHLAVQFQTFRPTANPYYEGFGNGRQYIATGDTINGVWQGDQQGNGVRLITHVDANTQVSNATLRLASITGWNLSAGSVAAVLPAPTAGTPPLALGYAWQSNGTIAAQSPFTDTTLPQSVPAGPVGRAGDVAFTFWQPGQVAVHILAPLGELQPPNGYVFDATFTALSPDGRYLTAPIEVRGLLEPDGQPPNPLVVANDHLEGLPRLPFRDAALRAVVDGLTRAANDGHDHGTALAWSPDGRYLAAQAVPATTAVDASHYPVSIYDTRSGQLLATLTPLARGGSQDLQDQRLVIALRWSPDSTHLLMEDTVLGTATIWGPDQLPHVG
jgi:WD40 repeat protein